MGKSIAILVCGLIILSTPVLAQHREGLLHQTPRVTGGLAVGYDLGMPLQGHFRVYDLAATLPVDFGISVGHSFFLDAGRPEEARHVFINENTNGVPTKSASRWSFGFDLLYQVDVLSMDEAFLYTGVRYSMFTASFDFIGGNEFFDVHAHQLGLAAGLESFFPMAQRIDLFCSLGGEYYLPATLEGHDAAYSPDGATVNQREDYTYSDADAAINQPKFQPRILLGINYHF